MWLAWAPVNTRYTGIPKDYQLLFAIYREIWPNSYASNLHAVDNKWFTVNKLIPTSESSIKEIGDSNMVDETSIVGKANMEAS